MNIHKVVSVITIIALLCVNAAIPVCAFADTDVSKLTFDGFEYKKIANNCVKITGYTGVDTDITIPSSIDGRKVTVIDKRAFAGKDGLSSVVIPDTVTQIGFGAFSDSSIKYVTIPDSVKTIGNWAFRASSIREVVLPASLKKIGASMFNDCWYLKRVVIPNSVKSIGAWAFCYCESLKEVVLPNSVTKLDKEAFFCSGLEKLTIPPSVKRIGSKCFQSTTVTMYGQAGSYAEKYAGKHDIPFVNQDLG